MIKRVVPWINREEWNDTYKDIYSKKKKNIKSGLDRITVWKSRCSTGLPVAIEVTYLLLKAKLLSFKNGKTCDDVQLRMLYSMATIQFVNLALEKYQTGMTMVPLRILALKLKIPSWIIELRHEATHKSLPQLFVLEKAVDFSLKYLKKNYWAKQSKQSTCNLNYSVDLIDSVNLNEKNHSTDEEKNICKEVQKNFDINEILEKYFFISKKFYYNRNLQGGHLKPIMKKIKQELFNESKNTLDVIFNKVEERLKDYKEVPAKNILDENLKVLWPMVSLISKFNKLNDLILHLLSIQTDDISIKKAICDFIMTIIKIYLNENPDRNIFYFNQPCHLNGRQLIQVAMKLPHCYTKDYITCFFKCCVEPFSKESERQLLDLLNIAAPKSNSNVHLSAASRGLKSPPSSVETTYGIWTVVEDKIKWTHWPIGKCIFSPNMNYQSLDLPKVFDNKRQLNDDYGDSLVDNFVKDDVEFLANRDADIMSGFQDENLDSNCTNYLMDIEYNTGDGS